MYTYRIAGRFFVYPPYPLRRDPILYGRRRCRLAYRNSKLETLAFPTTGGGGGILTRLYGSGPAVNYVVRIDLVEVSAGAGGIDDGASLSIEIPAGVAVGSAYHFDFGDGYRLGGDLVLSGAGTRSGTVTYYAGV